MSITGAIVSAPEGETAHRWQARLEVRFGVRDGRTVVHHRRHEGPLQLQRAFHPEGPSLCHSYLLHPPGGLVAGDALDIDVAVESGAAALVTTPAANKIYRGDERPPASVRQRLTVDANSSLEWFPQETILFDGARAELATEVQLAEGSALVTWEILCLGRPAIGETLTRGACRQTLAFWRAGRPLCLERARFEGGAAVLRAPWGLGGAPVTATLVATPVPTEIVADLRTATLGPGELAGVTVLGDVLVCRYLGRNTEAARHYFSSLWRVIRPVTIGRAAHPPRIWAT